MPHKYILETGLQVLLKDMNLSAQDVLRHARLPLDLMSRKSPTLTAEESLRLWDGLAYVMRDDPLFPLHLVEAFTVEAFSPPIFACFCSSDLSVAAKRLSYYKPLVGPLRLDVKLDNQQMTIAIRGLSEKDRLPSSLILMELAFWVQIARRATREHIIPTAILVTFDLPLKEEYEAFFGIPVRQGKFNGVIFSAEDASKPFLTANDQMWEIFEPNLNMRMQDLNQGAHFRDKVRACLMEIIASGQYSMADVASRLAVSTRTLQRRLKDEGTSFQKELDSLREELARNYLSKSDYTSGQIAFLLGYDDPNSFFRAFRSWTGQTPEFVRSSLQ